MEVLPSIRWKHANQLPTLTSPSLGWAGKMSKRYVVFLSGHPSKYGPRPTLLNFSDLTGTVVYLTWYDRWLNWILISSFNWSSSYQRIVEIILLASLLSAEIIFILPVFPCFAAVTEFEFLVESTTPE